MRNYRNRTARIPAAFPNWKSEVEAKYEFKTDIFTAFDGTERREAIRALPRVEITYDTLLHSASKQRHLNDIAWSHDRQFFVPVPWRTVNVISAAGADITVESVPFWLIEGVSVIVRSTFYDERFAVVAVIGDVVTLDSIPVQDPTGAKLSPSVTCRMSASAPLEIVTDNVLAGSETYELDPGSDPMLFAPITPEEEGGVDVLPWRPNWADGVGGKFDSLRRTFAPDAGPIYSDNPRNFNTRIMSASFLFSTREGGEEFLAFFARQRGRRGQFYADLGVTEFNASQVAVVGSSQIVIRGPDLFDTFGSSPIFHSLRAVTPVGEQTNQIAGVVLNGQGDSVVSFASPWVDEITTKTRLFWRHAWRFATDRLELRWHTDGVCEIDTSFQAIPTEGA